MICYILIIYLVSSIQAQSDSVDFINYVIDHHNDSMTDG
jgi:hypothetical protein